MSNKAVVLIDSPTRPRKRAEKNGRSKSADCALTRVNSSKTLSLRLELNEVKCSREIVPLKYHKEQPLSEYLIREFNYKDPELSLESSPQGGVIINGGTKEKLVNLLFNFGITGLSQKQFH